MADPDLFEAFEDYAWSMETKVILLARFILEQGLNDDFEDFLAAIADEEDLESTDS